MIVGGYCVATGLARENTLSAQKIDWVKAEYLLKGATQYWRETKLNYRNLPRFVVSVNPIYANLVVNLSEKLPIRNRYMGKPL